jgi:hypothetical protein
MKDKTLDKSKISILHNNTTHILSTIEQCQQAQYFDNVEGNARVVIAYLHTQLGFADTNTDYTPHQELELAITTIQSLPPNSPVLKAFIDILLNTANVIISRDSMVKDAVIKKLNDLSIEVPTVALTPRAPLIQSADSVISTLIGMVLDNLLTSITSEYHFGLATLVASALKALFPSDAYQAQITAGIVKISDRLKISEQESPSVPKDTPLVAVLYAYGNEKITPESVKLLITHLMSSSLDKKEQAKQIISAIQTVFNEKCYRKGHSTNVILALPMHLFPVLDEFLPVNQLEELLAETDFKLHSYSAAEHEDTFSTYTLSNQLMFNECIEDMLNNRYNNLPNEIFAGHIPPILRMAGRRAASEFSLVKEEAFCLLPPAMQIQIAALDAKEKKQLGDFLQIYIKVNKQAERFQQRDLAAFFYRYGEKMMQLIQIMGTEAITVLRKQLAGTVLSLEQFISIVPTIDDELIPTLKDYFATLRTPVHPEQVELFITCLISITILKEMGAPWKEEMDIPYNEREEAQKRAFKDYIMGLATGHTPQEFLRALVQVLISKLLPNMDIELSDDQIATMLERMPPERFAKLANASHKMQHDQYREVFLELLKLDLTGGSIDQFLHDPKQTNQVGQDLALHNQAIRAQLTAKGIDPSMALNYTYKHHFIVTTGSVESNTLDNQYLVLWDYILQLNEQTKRVLSQEKIHGTTHEKQLKAILKSIDAIKKSIEAIESEKRTSQAIAKLVQQDINKALITKIKKNITALMSHGADLPAEFNEFAQHMSDQVELISASEQRAKEAPVAKNLKPKTHYFSVEQWSKEKTMTFFLADEVGCCLATNGHQFQAMVQRRMDDGMLFHVVIDQSTGKPAALVWLYLAETSTGDIALMSNFFEIHAKYGISDETRKAILHGLLEFNQHYLKDNPQIKGFYMNQLKYGWHKNDISSYPVKHLAVKDKIGGPYIAGDIKQRMCWADAETQAKVLEKTRNMYYLVSLNESSFHEFSPAVLAQEVTPGFVSLADKIRAKIISSVDATKPVDEMLQTIMAQLRVELEHFYQKPLSSNPALITELEAQITEALRFKQEIQRELFELTKDKSVSAQEAIALISAHHQEQLIHWYGPVTNNPAFAEDMMKAFTLATAFHEKQMLRSPLNSSQSDQRFFSLAQRQPAATDQEAQSTLDPRDSI